jgi:WD40 repeat protein
MAQLYSLDRQLIALNRLNQLWVFDASRDREFAEASIGFGRLATVPEVGLFVREIPTIVGGHYRPDRLEMRDRNSLLWQRPMSWFLSVLEFSADGRMVAAGAENGTIEVIDARSGDSHAVWLGTSASLRLATLSPTARTLAVLIEPQNAVNFWHPDTGRDLFTFPTDFRYVRSLAFTPDGNHLVIAGSGPNGHGQILLMPNRNPMPED